MSGALLPQSGARGGVGWRAKAPERPLHVAFRRPSIQPKHPDKMMAGAAGPQRRPAGRARLYLPPSQLGASASTPVASSMGLKHGDDRGKPPPWEMPVVRQGGGYKPPLNAALSVAPASSSDETRQRQRQKVSRKIVYFLQPQGCRADGFE